MHNSVVVVSISVLEFDVILVMLLARGVVQQIGIWVKDRPIEWKGCGCQCAENVTGLIGKEMLGIDSMEWVILVVGHVFKPRPVAIWYVAASFVDKSKSMGGVLSCTFAVVPIPARGKYVWFIVELNDGVLCGDLDAIFMLGLIGDFFRSAHGDTVD